jgi:hypothetical protein
MYKTAAGIAQSVQRLATGWSVREPNPSEARFSVVYRLTQFSVCWLTGLSRV